MILTFANTRAVIQAERELKINNFNYQVIPTPRHISSECGMCLKISEADLLAILELFETKNIIIIRQVENDNESKF